uniref:Uncharacterized protein n=1 Tax=Panagrolaimus sp. ES5 TaxID=591445 RepID=A0AC34GBL3_9BILA
MDDDKKITIIVKAAECPIFIRRSKIYVEPTTTTFLPTTVSDSSAVSNASTYIWIIIVVGILLFIIGVIIGIVICWKKRLCIFKKEAEVKKKITFTDTANSTIITKDEDVLKADLPKPPPPPKPTLKTVEETPPPPPKAAKKSKKKSGKKSKKSKKVNKEKKDVKKDTVEDAATPTSAPPHPSIVPVKLYIPPVQGLTQEQVLEEDYYFRKPNKERLRNAKKKEDVKKDTVEDAATPTSAPPPPSFVPVKSYIPPVQGLTQEKVLEEDYYFRKPNKERLQNAKSWSKSNSSKTSFVRQIERKTPKARLEAHYSSMKRNGIIMTEKCKELE